MLDTAYFDKLAKNLFQALPDTLQSLEQTCSQQFKDILQSAFQSLNLVTREEFDVQIKVLARTREKLDKLETLVKSMQTDRDAEKKQIL